MFKLKLIYTNLQLLQVKALKLAIRLYEVFWIKNVSLCNDTTQLLLNDLKTQWITMNYDATPFYLFHFKSSSDWHFLFYYFRIRIINDWVLINCATVNNTLKSG